MNEYQNKLGKKKINQFHQLAIKLQDNFSEELLDEVLEKYLRIEAYDKLLNERDLRDIYSILPLPFFRRYAIYAASIIDENPISWVSDIKPIIQIFDDSKYNVFLEEISSISPNSMSHFNSVLND